MPCWASYSFQSVVATQVIIRQLDASAKALQALGKVALRVALAARLGSHQQDFAQAGMELAKNRQRWLPNKIHLHLRNKTYIPCIWRYYKRLFQGEDGLPI